MLFSSAMIAYTLLLEIVKNGIQVSWDAWQWHPSNIVTVITYYTIVIAYSKRYEKVKCWIPKKLKSYREKKE